MIVGCDYHPGFQQIAFVDTDTGELQERRLDHPEVAEKFYRELADQGMKVHVGMEASGHARWFERATFSRSLMRNRGPSRRFVRCCCTKVSKPTSKEGPKFMQRLVAKQKARFKDS